MESKLTIKGMGLKIVLDADEVFPADPGNGCPALVEHSSGATGTFWCVRDTGEMMSDNWETLDLTGKQMDWLDKQSDKVDTFVDYWSKVYPNRRYRI